MLQRIFNAARFVVRQGDATVYDKVLSIQRKWESSFVGAVAVRDAITQYGAMFQRLQRKLFDDPDFLKLT
ncbi:hypothetical protein HBDW_08270 [Herbaspirillum sp. DW155]|uniref:hypothetical protein n=1 Tax=Herbaspirillum sp. DW155 TaxID=3095609 RepID=UPI00308E68E1|nr:hypothetical protein HBDW_08270 [Herbaspirillum sp. DW155]